MTTTAGPPQPDELLMVIDGSPRAARSGRTYTSTDPYTGQPWAQVPDADAQGCAGPTRPQRQLHQDGRRRQGTRPPQ